jgi:hypothetical protein
VSVSNRSFGSNSKTGPIRKADRKAERPPRLMARKAKATDVAAGA